jgi:hypothetical protein
MAPINESKAKFSLGYRKSEVGVLPALLLSHTVSIVATINSNINKLILSIHIVLFWVMTPRSLVGFCDCHHVDIHRHKNFTSRILFYLQFTNRLLFLLNIYLAILVFLLSNA